MWGRLFLGQHLVLVEITGICNIPFMRKSAVLSMAISQAIPTPHEKEAFGVAARGIGGLLRGGGSLMKSLGGIGSAGRGLGMAGRGAIQAQRAATSALPTAQRVGSQAFGGNAMRDFGRSMWNTGQRMGNWGKARAARPPVPAATPPPMPGAATAGPRYPGGWRQDGWRATPRPTPAGFGTRWYNHPIDRMAHRSPLLKPLRWMVPRSLMGNVNMAMLGGNVLNAYNHGSQLQDASNYGAARMLHEQRNNLGMGLGSVLGTRQMVSDGLNQRGYSGISNYMQEFAQDPSSADSRWSRGASYYAPGANAAKSLYSRIRSQ